MEWLPAIVEAGEGRLCGGGRDDVVGSVGVDVERDAVLVIVEDGRVDDTLQHGPLGVRDLPVENVQVPGLRMTAVSEGSADGLHVFRSAVGACEHHHRPYPGQFSRPAFIEHPG